MDVLFFLKKRTKFIRHFYETAEKPFMETIHKIVNEVSPFDEAPYEDCEPPFMQEWTEATRALDVLGRCCISMLSASIKLYFKTWESKLCITWDQKLKDNVFKKQGFIKGYQLYFGEVLGLSWDDCPADFDILEQIVLARISDQHPDSIARLEVKHSLSDRRPFSERFFVSDTERKLFADPEMADVTWMKPTVHVSREMLFSAIKHVDELGEWLEPKMLAAKNPR